MLFIPFRELPPITTAMTLTTGAWLGLNRLSRIQSGRVFTPDPAVKVVTVTIEGDEGTEHHGHDGGEGSNLPLSSATPGSSADVRKKRRQGPAPDRPKPYSGSVGKVIQAA